MYTITVDGVVYKGTKALVDTLGLGIDPGRLYRYYVRKKQDYTKAELDEAVEWIRKTTKTREQRQVEEKVDNLINLAELLYNLLDKDKTRLDTYLIDFLLGLPIQDAKEEVFQEYIKNNYSRLKPIIPTEINLEYLLDVIKQYKEGQLSFELRECIKDTDTLIKEGKVMTISYYMKKYHLGYNSAYTIRRDYQNGMYETYDDFLKALEEKSRFLSKKSEKK